jgi:hypothetical protein
MKREIYKHPFNATPNEGTKIFLSEFICQRIIIIRYRNVRIICTINDKIIHKKKEITLSSLLILVSIFSIPHNAHSIGLTPIVRPSEINRPTSQDLYHHAPVVPPRLERIFMVKTPQKIPLIYSHEHYSYINKELLKELRAGDLGANLTALAIVTVTYMILLLSNIPIAEAYALLARLNGHPTTCVGFGQAPSHSRSSTEIAVVPTRAQEFNDMSLDFNKPRISYEFVISNEEAHFKINQMYSGVLEISPNQHISDRKAASKIYHASQLGVDPEDYGMTKANVKRISEIGIHNYAREGRPLPPIELVKAYQDAIKNICTNGQSFDGTYSSKAEQKVHKAKYRYNPETREVAGFSQETGELITSTKYKESTFQKFILTKNLGKL